MALFPSDIRRRGVEGQCEGKVHETADHQQQTRHCQVSGGENIVGQPVAERAVLAHARETEQLRNNRIALLQKISHLYRKIADFSQLQIEM